MLFPLMLNSIILELEKHVRESIISGLLFISPAFPVVCFYSGFCYLIKCIDSTIVISSPVNYIFYIFYE